MIKQLDRDLAAELVKKGSLTQELANKYLVGIQSSNNNLRDYLISNKFVSEKEVLDALGAMLGLENVDLKSIAIEESVFEKVPVRVAWYFKFVPIKIEGKTLTLATYNPLDVKFQDEIRVHIGLEPKIVLAQESDVIDALNKHYGLAADTVEKLSKETEKDAPAELDSDKWIEDLEQETDDASVAKLVNQILLEAYKKRATDIHIEPYRDKVRIRYRIDGVLVDANLPPAVKELLPPVISRIKIMANLSIVEKRLPQDGSAVVSTKEQDLDMRISTIPTPRGESIVIRILPTNVRLLSLEKLGLDSKNLKTFRTLVQKPNGIILVTGPTGSGKTTTLYACLNEINSPDRKIITLEDPVECEMAGVTQIQINPKVDMDFAAGLRSVLRHDPDIIMVGEVRDLETAEIAIRTALTGHVVFSTLHTNDAASGVTRLIEMGVEPFLVASSVEAFIAQRLVRIICPKCKQEVKTPLLEIREEIAKSLDMEVNQVKIFDGRGCDHCNQTGFYGRTAIYETLAISDEVRTAILEKRRADHIKKIAMKNGMETLRQAGWRKVINGITIPSEVVNITMRDEELVASSEAAVSTGGAEQAGSSGGASQESKERIINKEVLAQKNEYDSRAYVRVRDKVGIRYATVRQDKDNPNKISTEKVEHFSVTKDISAAGIRFISGYSIEIGTILELKIQFDKTQKSVDCLAKVCRIEDDTLSSMFNVCAYYLDISSADRVRLDNFVKMRIKAINEGKGS